MFIQDNGVESRRSRRMAEARYWSRGRWEDARCKRRSAREAEHDLRWKQLLETA
jgi:hypothetical protein